jgi:hypothetical protein
MCLARGELARAGSIRCEALQRAPHARAVVAIGVAKLALEIGFLTRHDAVANDEGEGRERSEQPEIVEGDSETDELKTYAKVDGIAREAVGSGLDDGGGRHAGGTFEPARVRVMIAQATSVSAATNTIPPIQPAVTEAGMNGMAMIHWRASPASTASAHAIGGRMMTLAVSVVSFMAGLRSLHSFGGNPLEDYLPALEDLRDAAAYGMSASK